MAGANGAQDLATVDPTAPPADAFDLDVLEHEATHAPFPFRLGGQSFHLNNPDELDWHEQAELDSNDLRRIFAALLGSEQFARFDAIPDVPAWKLERLMVAWGKHYGISLPESVASSTSSAPTARPSRPISAATTAPGSPTSVAAG